MASLMLANEAFSRLTRLTPSDDVAAAFEAFRAKVWEVIELANDPAAYTQACNLINKYAQSSLVEFSQGNINSLDELKECVNASIELMP